MSLVGKYTFKITCICQLYASIIRDRINFNVIFLDTPINNVIISSLLSHFSQKIFFVLPEQLFINHIFQLYFL